MRVRGKGKKKQRIEQDSARPSEISAVDSVWTFVQQVESEILDGRWYPRTLAEWFGCPIDISPPKLGKLFLKYCSTRTPNPELLALFLTHRLLRANCERRKGSIYGKKFHGKREKGKKGNMAATLPQTRIPVRIFVPEVSIQSGEQLIAKAHQLVTEQYWNQYRQNYVGKISWEEFCKGAPQNLKFFVPKDPWFINPNKLSPVKASMTDAPVAERRVVERSEDEEEGRLDHGEEPVAGPSKPRPPAQDLQVQGLSVRNPAFPIRSIPPKLRGNAAMVPTAGARNPALCTTACSPGP